MIQCKTHKLKMLTRATCIARIREASGRKNNHSFGGAMDHGDFSLCLDCKQGMDAFLSHPQEKQTFGASRVCRACGKVLPLTDGYFNRAGKFSAVYGHVCRPCIRKERTRMSRINDIMIYGVSM